MNKFMDLWQSSVPVDNRCQMYCRSHANLVMQCEDALLVRWKTKSGKIHYVWVSSAFEDGVICRAFLEDDEFFDDDMTAIEELKVVEANKEVFLFNGRIYYLEDSENHHCVIRRINTYSSQSVIEQLMHERYPQYVIESIYLANFYMQETHQRKYIITCWGVTFEEGRFYIPIFDNDRHWFDEYDVQAFIISEIAIGTVFHREGFYYKTALDEKQKIRLIKSNNPFVFNKKEVPQIHKEPTKIISLFELKKSRK